MPDFLLCYEIHEIQKYKIQKVTVLEMRNYGDYPLLTGHPVVMKFFLAQVAYFIFKWPPSNNYICCMVLVMHKSLRTNRQNGLTFGLYQQFQNFLRWISTALQLHILILWAQYRLLISSKLMTYEVIFYQELVFLRHISSHLLFESSN